MSTLSVKRTMEKVITEGDYAGMISLLGYCTVIVRQEGR